MAGRTLQRIVEARSQYRSKRTARLPLTELLQRSGPCQTGVPAPAAGDVVGSGGSNLFAGVGAQVIQHRRGRERVRWIETVSRERPPRLLELGCIRGKLHQRHGACALVPVAVA